MVTAVTLWSHFSYESRSGLAGDLRMCFFRAPSLGTRSDQRRRTRARVDRSPAELGSMGSRRRRRRRMSRRVRRSRPSATRTACRSAPAAGRAAAPSPMHRAADDDANPKSRRTAPGHFAREFGPAHRARFRMPRTLHTTAAVTGPRKIDDRFGRAPRQGGRSLAGDRLTPARRHQGRLRRRFAMSCAPP